MAVDGKESRRRVTDVATDRAAQFTEARPLLFGLAYRMLGVRADAEDVVQEAFLRWQAARHQEIASPRAYLTTITARLALDQLKSARVKRETYVGTWLPEPLVNQPSLEKTSPEKMELAESLSVAFLHVLESLTPPERAAFLLREVFDAGYDEVAGVLETTEANSRQLVARARRHLQERRPRFTVDRAKQEEVLGRFLTACTTGDMTALRSLLRDDAVEYSDGGGKVYAAINPIFGADRIVRLFAGLLRKKEGELGGRAADVNGQPGFFLTLDGKPLSVLTLDLDETGRIRGIYHVLNPEKISHR
jgi:RNA polymerase sigma-70 factor (ECF subfamily)